MLKWSIRSLQVGFWVACIGAGLAFTRPAIAQDTGPSKDLTQAEPSDGSKDAPQSDEADASTNSDQANSGPTNSGPVRLAHIDLIQGEVSWRADESLNWSQATTNLPLRQGAQIWVANGGRAEIQFDDGSMLRLGSGALAILKTLYSDAQGEYTQIALKAGLATLHSRNDISIYEIDTPFVSVKEAGPSRIRIGIEGEEEIAVQLGQATLEGKQGKVSLKAGDYLALSNPESALNPQSEPGEDSWDLWNDELDRALESEEQSDTEYLPSDVALVAGDLDDYGTWQTSSSYGHVWYPHVPVEGWRPYHEGHWVWVNPFGWTWVSSEHWGWAPYHYGTWICDSHGWGWVPGPVHQYWCPAVVNFAVYHGAVCWAPLAPSEVRYPPTLTIRFRNGNWANFFSIGGVGVYYPGKNGICIARPYSTIDINHLTYATNTTTNATGQNNRTYLGKAREFAATQTSSKSGNGFVPINAHRFPGGSYTTVAGFGSGGKYEKLSVAQASWFANGQTPAAPTSGSAPVAGPNAGLPNLMAFTPLRNMLPKGQPPNWMLQRSVYHTSVSTTVPHEVPNLSARIAVGSVQQHPFGHTTQAMNGATAAAMARASLGIPSMARPNGGNNQPVIRYNGAAAAARARASLGIPAVSKPNGSNQPVTRTEQGIQSDAGRSRSNPADKPGGVVSGVESRPAQQGQHPVTSGNTGSQPPGSGQSSTEKQRANTSAPESRPAPQVNGDHSTQKETPRPVQPQRQSDPPRQEPPRQVSPRQEPSRQADPPRQPDPPRQEPQRQPDPPRQEPQRRPEPVQQPEPPRQVEQPRPEPPRPEPPRQEPPRQEPPRQEPPHQDPPHQDPPHTGKP